MVDYVDGNMLDYQSRDCKNDPRFSSLWDETLNQGPVSVWPHCWWEIKFEVTHSSKQEKQAMLLLHTQYYDVWLSVVSS